MSVFEFPMVFPADGVSLVGRVYRNVDELVTPQPAVVATGSWLTVQEQMGVTPDRTSPTSARNIIVNTYSNRW